MNALARSRRETPAGDLSARRGLSRREFLVGALALSAGGRLLVPGPRQAAGAQPEAREIRLVTREESRELAPGRRVRALTFNGQVPGPEIRLREGERVRAVVENSLSEPTTIHWHGVDVPNRMDGVPGVTQKPIRPGEAFTYEFEARPSGTRWYHTHYHATRQLDLGLFGPLIVEPQGGDPFPFDRECTLVLDDWSTGESPALSRTADGTARRRGVAGGMMSGMMRGMGGMMGRMTVGGPVPPYDVMTVNGKAYPATEPLRVRKGETVRLRLLNGSADHTHVMRLAGHRLRVTHTDGNPLEEAVEVDAVPIAPSERYDLEFTASRAGGWLFYCAEPGHARAGEMVRVVCDGRESDAPDPPAEGVEGLELWHYGLGRGREVLPAPTGETRHFDLVLSGGMMMGSDIWTIDGRRYPDTEPIAVRKGDRVRVTLTNHSMEAHPMHLHGQSFRVLAVNGSPLARPLVKDSVDVEPHMGSVVIELTAHNPGDWFFHCHKPMHMDGGMATLVKIG
jgi:FtsP/CotA-like multicopper oxidase with cupredoxin domain